MPNNEKMDLNPLRRKPNEDDKIKIVEIYKENPVPDIHEDNMAELGDTKEEFGEED